jgi:hypothetical protein
MTQPARRTAESTTPELVTATTITVAVVYPDGALEQMPLSGTDGERSAKIALLIRAGSVSAIEIDDQDGPAALAWIDEFAERKGLNPNQIVSTLVDHRVAGTAVITGLGHSDRSSMTSIHDGLLIVLGQMSRDQRQTEPTPPRSQLN